jgi:hypothetical protein
MTATTEVAHNNDALALRLVVRRKNPSLLKPSSLLFMVLSFVAILIFPTSSFGQANQQFILQTATGGVTISGSTPTYSTSFGALDAFGAGTPAAGVTAIPVANGMLFYSPINFVMGNLLGHHSGVIKAYVSSNFTHPTAMILQGCASNATCTASGSYANISTNAGAPTTIVPNMPENSTATASIAIVVPDNNGAGAFSGTDAATITFVGSDAQNGQALNTVTLSLNPQSLVTAIQLTLSTAIGGAAINAASDYSIDFGNVNGMGVGPAAGLTVVPVGGGVIYGTPYTLTPAFSNFTSTTGTIKVAVSTNFAHSSVLSMSAASALAGPYSAISTSVGSPTVITGTATSRTALTHYLGLLVTTINGASAFNGADSATLTYTLTVP